MSKRLTLKCLKELGKERGVNSSKGACDMVKRTGCDADMGRRIFGYAIEYAQSNGRKTVMEKDVDGFVRLYRDLTERCEGGEETREEVREERTEEPTETKPAPKRRGRRPKADK